MEDNIMANTRKPRVPKEEQLKLINECRSRQDVVPIDIIPEHFPLQYNDLSPDIYHTLEVILGSATIRVSDKTDPELLSRTLQILKAVVC